MAESDPVEQRALANVLERLAARYPTLDRAHVASVIDEELARLDDGPLREYVPALVEHAADERLRAEAEPVRVTDPGGPTLVDDDLTDLDPLEVERRQREQRAGFLLGDLGGGSV